MFIDGPYFLCICVSLKPMLKLYYLLSSFCAQNDLGFGIRKYGCTYGVIVRREDQMTVTNPPPHSKIKVLNGEEMVIVGALFART